MEWHVIITRCRHRSRREWSSKDCIPRHKCRGRSSGGHAGECSGHTASSGGCALACRSCRWDSSAAVCSHHETGLELAHCRPRGDEGGREGGVLCRKKQAFDIRCIYFYLIALYLFWDQNMYLSKCATFSNYLFEKCYCVFCVVYLACFLHSRCLFTYFIHLVY